MGVSGASRARVQGPELAYRLCLHVIPCRRWCSPHTRWQRGSRVRSDKDMAEGQGRVWLCLQAFRQGGPRFLFSLPVRWLSTRQGRACYGLCITEEHSAMGCSSRAGRTTISGMHNFCFGGFAREDCVGGGVQGRWRRGLSGVMGTESFTWLAIRFDIARCRRLHRSVGWPRGWNDI